jgi:hypothetical protein
MYNLENMTDQPQSQDNPTNLVQVNSSTGNQQDYQTFEVNSKPSISIVFEDDALDKLQDLAEYLGISQDDIPNVLIKGMKLIDLIKDGGKLIYEKDGKQAVIDIKDL